jgi:hypothetical protein
LNLPMRASLITLPCRAVERMGRLVSSEAHRQV